MALGDASERGHLMPSQRVKTHRLRTSGGGWIIPLERSHSNTKEYLNKCEKRGNYTIFVDRTE